MHRIFGQIARRISEALGSATAFVIAGSAVILWVALGPIFGWSSGWQLLINTGTTIITFLMVFLIQNAQNRDTRAIQIKLDELLRAIGSARTGLIDVENLDDDEITRLQERFSELQQRHAEETAKAQEQTVAGVEDGSSQTAARSV